MEASAGLRAGLVARLIERVGAIPGVRVRGITDPRAFDGALPDDRVHRRRPSPGATSPRHLGERGIFAWDGDYYAWELIRALGLAESGGMVRVGLVNYNTAAEVDRVGDALEELVAG